MRFLLLSLALMVVSCGGAGAETVEGPLSVEFDLEMSPDGKMLALFGGDRFEARTRAVVVRVDGGTASVDLEDTVTALTWTPAGELLVVTRRFEGGNSVLHWVDSGGLPLDSFELSPSTQVVSGMTVMPDGETLVAAVDDPQSILDAPRLMLIDLNTGDAREWKGTLASPYSPEAISETEVAVVAGTGEEKRVVVANLLDGSTNTIGVEGLVVTDLTASPLGVVIYSGHSADGTSLTKGKYLAALGLWGVLGRAGAVFDAFDR